MRKLFFLLIALAGLWSIVHGLFFGGLAYGLCSGVLILGAGAFGFMQHQKNICGTLAAVLGLGTALLSCFFVPGFSLNALIVGLLTAGLGALATQIPTEVKSALTVDKDGNAMAEFKSISFSENGDILMKTELLGSMPSKIYMHPDQFWQLVGMVDFELLKAMPSIMFKGWRQYKAKKS